MARRAPPTVLRKARDIGAASFHRVYVTENFEKNGIYGNKNEYFGAWRPLGPKEILYLTVLMISILVLRPALVTLGCNERYSQFQVF